jgi:murein hydrolase activator
MAIRSCPETGTMTGTRPARSSTLARALALTALVVLRTTGGAEARPSKAEERRDLEQARLEKVRSEIVDLRERLSRIEARAGSVLDAIEELDLRVALLGRESDSLRREAEEAVIRETAAREEAARLEQRILSSEQELRDFLREVYKVGPTRYLRVVAASASPAQFAAGQRASEALGLGEANRIDAYRADRERLDGVLGDLGRQRENIERLGGELKVKDRELRDSRRRKEAVLSGLRHQQASQKRTLFDLVDQERQIEDLVGRLAREGSIEPVPSLGFARSRGILSWPARGRVAVPFGKVRHPRFSTIVPHPGIDIAAEPGQEVHAVFDGRVVFSDWFKGYGEMVVMDHGDGYLSIYGHVSERLVTVGANVRQGDLIARSGEGGSFDAPGLYFEIRHDGKPVDPVPWLRGSPGRTASGPASRRDAGRSRSAP